MALPAVIDLPGVPPIPILHEDGDCVVIDKPAGWRCAPADWDRAPHDLEEALGESMAGGAPWATRRGIRFLRAVNRLEAETSGVLLLARSPEAAAAYHRLFEDRHTLKEYLAVAGGKPPRRTWTCCLKIRPDPETAGRVLTHPSLGQHAETEFEALGHGEGLVLLVARPRTGRPHQIRVHLAAAGLPIVGDALYGFGRRIAARRRRGHVLAEGRGTPPARPDREPLALRAVRLAFPCPTTGQPIEITAPVEEFLAGYGFAIDDDDEGAVGEG